VNRDDLSWYPLAPGDPLPGDPAAVRAAGEEYSRVADQIAAAAEELRAIGGGFLVCSDAVDEVETKALRLADTIERAHGRYAAAGAALVGYADGLAHAQDVSLQAREKAVAGLGAQESAQDDLLYYERRAMDSADEPDVAQRYWDLADTARANLRSADRTIEDARVLLDSAYVVRDDAAEVAKAAISAVVRADDLHDTVWQDLGGGFQEVGLAVWNSLDEVAAIAGVAALALCWVPGLNAALAAIATIAGAVVLIRDVINLATGNGSWAEVGWSALGMLTFGIGRVAGAGLRAAANANRASQGLRITLGAADEAADVAQAASRAEAATTTAVSGSAIPVSAQMAPSSILRPRGLWNSLKPSAVASDLATDIRGGAQMLQAPGLYVAQRPGLHVARPVDAVSNPFTEARVALATTWSQSRTAALFQMLGNDAAARDAAYLLQCGDPASAWLVTTGTTQVGEALLVTREAAGLGAG